MPTAPTPTTRAGKRAPSPRTSGAALRTEATASCSTDPSAPRMDSVRPAWESAGPRILSVAAG